MRHLDFRTDSAERQTSVWSMGVSVFAAVRSTPIMPKMRFMHLDTAAAAEPHILVILAVLVFAVPSAPIIARQFGVQSMSMAVAADVLILVTVVVVTVVPRAAEPKVLPLAPLQPVAAADATEATEGRHRVVVVGVTVRRAWCRALAVPFKPLLARDVVQVVRLDAEMRAADFDLQTAARSVNRVDDGPRVVERAAALGGEPVDHDPVSGGVSNLPLIRRRLVLRLADPEL